MLFTACDFAGTQNFQVDDRTVLGFGRTERSSPERRSIKRPDRRQLQRSGGGEKRDGVSAAT